MAATYIVQIAHLTQDLIEHIAQANNLLMRTKHELEHIQHTTKMLVNVHDALEKDLGYDKYFK